MKKILKWTGIIVVILFVLTVIIGVAAGGNKQVSNSFNQGMNQAKQTVDNTQSPEKKIEDGIRAAVSSDIIQDVQVTKQVNGGYSVIVQTKEQDGTKTGIWMDMGDIYTAMYKQPMGVNQAAIVAHVDMVDRYGKTSDQVVMKTSLDKGEAEKVNWNEAQSTLDQMILPKVWTVDEINPSLR